MGYELHVEPSKCTITTSGGKSKHKLINYCDRNLAYKIVFAAGSKYSVPPDKMSGVIDVGKSAEVEITRKTGKGPEEVMTVEYAPANPDPSKGKNGEIAGQTVVKLKPTE
ncbi:hypothetical protein RB195_003845 [Necator americanus]|uniref:Uncharacterized protein n=2 Tax=Necator americanus TaxID=51031 RepID=A0ABR1DQN4_NECAM|nr:MSP domain protein [Necator americanus]ETN75488.1 MSP domain protein [Necator americanus]